MAEFKPGVFFSMSAEEYHSIEALSASGMKNLRQSPLDYYVRSALNPQRAKVQDEEVASEARALGCAFHTRICEGPAAFAARYAEKIEPVEGDGWLITCDDLKAALKTLDLKVSGSKAEQIERLLEANPKAKVWDEFVAVHQAAHDGKVFLSDVWMGRIEMAARMIERHTYLGEKPGKPGSGAFTGGAPEVSIFWVCPVIGVNCKARIDYLKPRAIVDLKTLAPMGDTPKERQIAIEFGRRRYFIQAAYYAEAADQVARLIKAGLVYGPCGEALLAALAADKPKLFMFVFAFKGPAQAAFGRTFPVQSMIFQAAKTEIETMKMTYKTCLDKYGPDVPWVEDSRIEAFADEDVPPWTLT